MCEDLSLYFTKLSRWQSGLRMLSVWEWGVPLPSILFSNLGGKSSLDFVVGQFED